MTFARRKAILVLYFIVFVDFFQMTFIFPFTPMLVASFGGAATTISSRVAILSSLNAVGSMIGAPLLGSLSDRVGRRPVFLVATLGAAASAVLLGSAYGASLGFALAIVGRVVSGLAGGTAGIANTYLVDIIPEEQRPQYMSRMTGMIGMGLAAGPVVGSFLFEHFSIRVACFCAACVSLANFLCVVMLLPNSSELSQGAAAALTGDREGDSSAAAEAVTGPADLESGASSVAREEQPAPPSSQGSSRLPCKIYILFMTSFMMAPICVVFDTFANLYITERFYSGDEKQGTILFSNCVASLGVMVFLIPFLLYQPFLKCVGFNGSIVIGVSLVVAGLISNGLATAPWMFLAATCLWASGFQLMGPVVPTLIGRLAPPESVGKAFGLLSSFGNVAMVISPAALTPLYNWHHPSVFFFLGMSIGSAGVILICISLQTAAPESSPPALRRVFGRLLGAIVQRRVQASGGASARASAVHGAAAAEAQRQRGDLPHLLSGLRDERDEVRRSGNFAKPLLLRASSEPLPLPQSPTVPCKSSEA